MLNLIRIQFYRQGSLMIGTFIGLCVILGFLLAFLSDASALSLVSFYWFLFFNFVSINHGNSIFINSLSYSRKQIIHSSYIAYLIFINIILIILSIHYFTSQLSWEYVLFIYWLVLFNATYYLPVESFSRPSKFIKIANAFIAVLITKMLLPEKLGLLPLGFIKVLPPKIAKLLYYEIFTPFTTYSKSELYLILIIVTYVLYALSWLICVKAYEKKDL